MEVFQYHHPVQCDEGGIDYIASIMNDLDHSGVDYVAGIMNNLDRFGEKSISTACPPTTTAWPTKTQIHKRIFVFEDIISMDDPRCSASSRTVTRETWYWLSRRPMPM